MSERTKKRKETKTASPGIAFRDRVLQIVRTIPRGRVLTYGDVALLAGAPRGSRQVGRIMFFFGRSVPWQRVINHYGGLSTYKVGSGELQRALLEDEGVVFRLDGTVDLAKFRWRPRPSTLEKLELAPELLIEFNARLPFSR